MTPERAQEIVTAINDRALLAMGIDRNMGSLEGVSLAEMLAATEIVAAGNKAREHVARQTGTSCSISIIPAERLIAAVYTLENYKPGNEAIAIIPTNEWPYDRRAIGVVGLEPEPEDQEG